MVVGYAQLFEIMKTNSKGQAITQKKALYFAFERGKLLNCLSEYLSNYPMQTKTNRIAQSIIAYVMGCLRKWGGRWPTQPIAIGIIGYDFHISTPFSYAATTKNT